MQRLPSALTSLSGDASNISGSGEEPKSAMLQLKKVELIVTDSRQQKVFQEDFSRPIGNTSMSSLKGNSIFFHAIEQGECHDES